MTGVRASLVVGPMVGLVLGLVVFLSVVPVASAAPFLQAGYDAQRTGNVPGEGPLEHEVAMPVALPGLPRSDAPPVILDGAVYVLVTAHRPGIMQPDVDTSSAFDRSGIVKVDPDSGQVEMLLTLDEAPSTMASDGERLFVVDGQGVSAYGLDGGEPVWTWDFPLPATAAVMTTCVEPAVLEGALYLACTQEVDQSPVAGDPAGLAFNTDVTPIPLLVRLAADDGVLEATWPAAEAPGPGSMDDLNAARACRGEQMGSMRLEGLTVASPERALVLGNAGPDYYEDGDSSGAYMLFAVDTKAGRTTWPYCFAPTASQYVQSYAGGSGTDVLPAVAADHDRAYLLQSQLTIVDLESGEVLQSVPLLEESPDVRSPASTTTEQTGIALRGSGLWLQGYGDVIKVDTAVGEPRVEWRVHHGGQSFERYFPALAGNVLYVPGLEVLRAVDAVDGRELWVHDVEHPRGTLTSYPPPTLALGDGVLVVADPTGVLTVLGRTGVSIVPSIEVSDPWPDAGETVHLDLSGTQPSVLGATMEYQVDWGDGTISAWQEDPVLDHAYATDGQRVAQASVRTVDDDGRVVQRSFETVTFDVGGSPPVEPNFVETAFARENQDLTFGLLGITVAVAGGAIGVASRRRRRTRLSDELAAVERLYEETRHRPAECEAQLTERKAHARGLLADGELTEEQYPILEARIEELHRDLRLSAVHEEFDFLPHRMVRALQDILEDGRISEMEKEGFLRVLEGDEMLTEAYKERVRARIEAWYARDAGGPR